MIIADWIGAHFWPWIFIGGCVALAATIGFAAWWILTEPAHDTEPWEDGWQIEPVTDLDADTMAAEWRGTDLPGRSLAFDGTRVGESRAGAGELHHSRERTVTRDVWDEWWQGLDGLDRECLTVTRWREREERLWAELKAETDDLCPLAVAA